MRLIPRQRRGVPRLAVAALAIALATTIAVLVSGPVDVGVTTMVAVALALLARSPRSQTTVASGAEQVPWVALIGPSTTSAGRMWVRITWVAGEGPEFVTVTV